MADYGFNDDARLFHRPNMRSISKQATAVFKLGHSDAAACPGRPVPMVVLAIASFTSLGMISYRDSGPQQTGPACLKGAKPEVTARSINLAHDPWIFL